MEYGIEVFKTADDVHRFLTGVMIHPTEKLYVWLTDRPAMAAGSIVYCSPRECEQNGIEVVRLEHMDGSILCFPGDLTLMNVSHGNSGMGRQIMLTIQAMLTEGGFDARIDGNDVLVNGLKVASWTSTRAQNYTATYVQCSVNTDTELIRKLCRKPMYKIPGALRDFGISASDIWDRMGKDGIIGEAAPRSDEIWARI